MAEWPVGLCGRLMGRWLGERDPQNRQRRERVTTSWAWGMIG